MRARFSVQKLFRLMCIGGMIGLSTNAFATAFQLWEQDGASVGDYHAGRAAAANDATTSYYNPAGITRIKNQQIVLGDVGVLSDLKYRGTTSVGAQISNIPGITIPYFGAQNINTVAQGGSFSQLPDFFYVAPITSNIGVGLSLAVPFGLRTDYGRDSALRYAATKSEIQVVDLSPAVGFNVTQKLSLGAGVDMERMAAEFDQMAYAGPDTDSYSTNKGWSTAYGFHLGALYQFLPTTRVGLTYNSQVVHHIRGTSRFTGPIANAALGVPLGTPATVYSREANAHVTLPPFTTLSGFHQLNQKWALMGTVIYTQWSVIQNLTLNDLAAATAIFDPFAGVIPVASTSTTVNLPTHYTNTWNLSVGTEFYATDKVTLRGGLGWDETPVQNAYRDVRIPDKDRYAIALGGHFQATKTLGLDLGWTHLFMIGQARVNPPPEVTGAQVTTTNGNVQGSADVFGAQLTWDIV
jgi:long-chain fatty acid transport protein